MIESYLRRLGVERPAAPDAAALARLHEAHLVAVPFENLSVLWKEPIVLDVASLHRKVVGGGRGGFCYELNTLFAWGLRALGYEVDLLSARVPRQDGTLAPPFDHMCLRVRASGREWLADVGFGDSFRRPLPLEADAELVEERVSYALRPADGDLRLLSRQGDGPWKLLYQLDPTPRRLEEFGPMLAFHQSSPESPFTKRRICSRATAWGRLTLSERALVRTTLDGERTEEPIADEAAWTAVLHEHFGVRRASPAVEPSRLP